MDTWNETLNPQNRYSFHDIAYRLAGTGSLGLERYVVLASKAALYYFLDAKRAQSASINNVINPSVNWDDDAERIISIQRMTQHVSPSLLTKLTIGDKAFVLQELQPEEDKLDFLTLKAKKEKIGDAICSMAEMAASAYLRSSGWKGSSTVDTLIGFAQQDRWKKELMDFANVYSHQVTADYKQFMKAYASGELLESQAAIA